MKLDSGFRCGEWFFNNASRQLAPIIGSTLDLTFHGNLMTGLCSRIWWGLGRVQEYYVRYFLERSENVKKKLHNTRCRFL